MAKKKRVCLRMVTRKGRKVCAEFTKKRKRK
jgi:hypothetical protein